MQSERKYRTGPFSPEGSQSLTAGLQSGFAYITYVKLQGRGTEYPFPISERNCISINQTQKVETRFERSDLEKQCIYIRQGLVVYHSADENKHVMEKTGLKNKFRRRTIPITDDALWQRLQQTPRTVTIGKNTILTEEIIHSPEGKPYQPNNWENRVYRRFMRDLRAVHPEIPMLSPHELRHTRATLWIAQGMDPYMAARLLGHSDLKMLTKIYDHTDTETLRSALLAVGRNAGKKEETAL